MVYTLGNKESYRRGLKEHGEDFKKLGRTEDYSGGSVWQTSKEVFDYIKENSPRLDAYGVFEIDANWEQDTEECGESFHDLLKTSRITREIIDE
jgi:hypothetical protein